MTTVGLGDYIPGDSEEQSYRHLYKICTTAYLIIGVTIMVWIIQVFSEIPELNMYKYFTLIKNGMLISHRDNCNIHSAASSTLFNVNNVNDKDVNNMTTIKVSRESTTLNNDQQQHNNYLSLNKSASDKLNSSSNTEYKTNTM